MAGKILNKYYEIVRPRKLVPVIIRQLLEIIEKENLVIGDKLPSEKELSEAFGVGRSSIREALQALESYGIIKVKKGVGRFLIKDIKLINNDKLAEWMEKIIEDTPLVKILEARISLEVAIAGLSAKRVKQKNIDVMLAMVDGLKKEINDISVFFKKELEFHKYVYSICNNEILIEFANTLIDKMFEVEATMKNVTSVNMLEAIDSANDLIDAFKTKKVEEVEAIIEKHLSKVILEHKKDLML